MSGRHESESLGSSTPETDIQLSDHFALEGTLGNRKKSTKRLRIVHNEEGKNEALQLADTVGVTVATEQFSLQTSQLDAYRLTRRRFDSTRPAER